MIHHLNLANIPATYSIWYEDVCLYIGATSELRQRIASHLSTGVLKKLSNMPLEDLSLDYELQPDLETAELREKELLKKHHPIYNLAHNQSLFNNEGR